MRSKICASAAALILSASVAFANPSQSTDRKDLQVLKDVATSVQRYTRFTIFDDVSASVKDGVVTLTGRVTMPFKHEDIAKRVAKIDGLTAVPDQIGLLPAPPFDPQLPA